MPFLIRYIGVYHTNHCAYFMHLLLHSRSASTGIHTGANIQGASNLIYFWTEENFQARLQEGTDREISGSPYFSLFPP